MMNLTPTILIVDDNPNNLRVLEGILHTAGYKIRPALNGETALRAAVVSSPDLILLDIRMPGMDGYEVCKQLKQDPQTRDIPVIFISALQEMDDKIHAFQAGGVDYIVKPFQSEEVLTRARTHIDLARARNALAHTNEILEQQVAERTRELSESHTRLEHAMCEEHALRELLALSHHHFADQDYPVRALASLAVTSGWQPPALFSAILTTAGSDNDARLTLAASEGFSPRQDRALAGLSLAAEQHAKDGAPCLTLRNAQDCSDMHVLLELPENQQAVSLLLASGDKLFGVLVLAGEAAKIASQRNLAQQVADVLAMGFARRHADEKLAWQGYHDELTGLPNRRLLEQDLQREMRTSDSRGNYCGILLLDLDQFKLLNDALGHNAGDSFLKEISIRLKNTVRASDLPYRWGGDEFIVLLPGIGNSEDEAMTHARSAADKIARNLSQPLDSNGQSIQINASMGIALYPCDGNSAEELLMHVDLAMHKAKEAGRNTIHFFQPEMQGDAERRLQLEKDIRSGLAEQQFLLHYQPQVNGNGQLTGAESLVRWQHPQRGLVFPGDFIAIAEEAGLIQPLGEWVMLAACQQLRTWIGNGPNPGHFLAVNVSARQFHQPDFIDKVRRTLDATGADPTALELEVTESLLLADIDGAVKKMATLRDMGIRFSVDDFGTGYSSLSYLRHLPVEQLKIDRSFVQDVHLDSRNAAIVRTIISLANNLGMETIAEGVELEEEFRLLVDAGCDRFQGYYFSKPLAIESFAEKWQWA